MVHSCIGNRWTGISMKHGASLNWYGKRIAVLHVGMREEFKNVLGRGIDQHRNTEQIHPINTGGCLDQSLQIPAKER